MVDLVNQGRGEGIIWVENIKGNCQAELFSAKINSRANNHTIKQSSKQSFETFQALQLIPMRYRNAYGEILMQGFQIAFFF